MDPLTGVNVTASGLLALGGVLKIARPRPAAEPSAPSLRAGAGSSRRATAGDAARRWFELVVAAGALALGGTCWFFVQMLCFVAFTVVAAALWRGGRSLLRLLRRGDLAAELAHVVVTAAAAPISARAAWSTSRAARRATAVTAGAGRGTGRPGVRLPLPGRPARLQAPSEAAEPRAATPGGASPKTGAPTEMTDVATRVTDAAAGVLERRLGRRSFISRADVGRLGHDRRPAQVRAAAGLRLRRHLRLRQPGLRLRAAPAATATPSSAAR